MEYSVWLFVGFTVFLVFMLAIDLGIFHRKAHVVGLREASLWYAVWVSLAVIFNIGIFLWQGHDKGLEFLTGYVIELSLSVDNVFIFLIIFSYFAVPAQYQHRVLFYGILGALVMRGLFIVTGVALLNLFHWIIYVFGIFLVFTGIKLALRKDEEVHPERNPVIKLARRFLPVTQDYDGQRFFIRRHGRLMATPLCMVLLVIETTDLVFAMDSVPAILAITRDPFIVWTSNVFAILGLRALFFMVAGMLRHFRYLNIGLALVLCFVGFKMLISDLLHVPTAVSLGAVAGILAVTILASYLPKRRAVGAKVCTADAQAPNPHSLDQGADTATRKESDLL